MEQFQRLEREFADWCGLDPANMVACASGTAALHLAFQANSQVIPGRCLMSDYVMVSCPLGPYMAGCLPTFVDCEWGTLNIDPLKANREVIRHESTYARVSSLLAVHVYGRRCPMAELASVADAGSLYLVEDLAEAHGVVVHPRTDAAVWSFYKNKLVAGEEGGCVWFKNKGHADRARLLRSIGTLPDHSYTHVPFGHNYRMSNAHASLVLASLREVNVNTRLRGEQWERYYQVLSQGRIKPDSPWVYDVLLPKGVDRKALVDRLRSLHVPVRYGFRPMTKQEQFYGETPPVVESIWDRIVYINLEPEASASVLEQRCRSVREAFKELI